MKETTWLHTYVSVCLVLLIHQKKSTSLDISFVMCLCNYPSRLKNTHCSLNFWNVACLTHPIELWGKMHQRWLACTCPEGKRIKWRCPIKMSADGCHATITCQPARVPGMWVWQVCRPGNQPLIYHMTQFSSSIILPRQLSWPATPCGG